jgi:hypothetical protein
MKRTSTLISIVLAFLIVVPSAAFASPTLVPNGGTGWGKLVAGTILIGNDANKIATSTNLTFSTSLNRLTTLYASTTAVSATTLCLTGDTCRTTWPSASVSGGTAGMVTAWLTSSTLTATGTPTVTSIVATSSTATSTFQQDVWIGSPTELPGPYLIVASTSVPFYTRVAGDAVDVIYSWNGQSSINIGNQGVGNCASATYFANGNNPTLGGYYGTYSFLNDGWAGVGCSIGAGTGQHPEAVVAWNPTGEMDFGISSTTNNGWADFKWWTQGNTATNTRMVLTNFGSLGIATTSPWGYLSVAGTSTSITNLVAMSTSTATATSTAFVIDAQGRVGIGLSVPTTQLQVIGTASTSQLTVSALNAASCDVKASTAGVLSCGVDATGAGGSYPFNPTPVYNGQVTAGTTSVLWLTGTTKSLAASSSDLTFASTTMITTGSGAVGTPAIQINDAGGLYRGAAGTLSFSNLTSGFSWNGTAVYPNTDIARDLGIDATNRWRSIYATYASTTGVSTVGSVFAGTTAGGMLSVGSTTPWGLLSVNANGFTTGAPQFTVGSSTWQNFIVANNGKVGVATSAPWALFSINPDDTLGQVGNKPLFVIGSSTATLVQVNASANAFLSVASSTPWATITAIGNGTNLILGVASSSNTGLPSFSVDKTGRVYYSGAKPTCDANCTFLAGNDMRFRVRVGTTITSTTVTFSQTWGTNAPICSADEGDAGTVVADASSTPTTVVITLASALTAKDIEVWCDGIQ